MFTDKVCQVIWPHFIPCWTSRQLWILFIYLQRFSSSASFSTTATLQHKPSVITVSKARVTSESTPPYRPSHHTSKIFQFAAVALISHLARYQSQPHYQPGDYHSPVYSYIADFPSKYSGNVQPQHNSLRLRPDGSFVPEYSASRPSYKYQGSHLGNQFRLFSDGSYQPSAPQSSPLSYYESTHSNINQFYNSPNKYTFSDGVFQDNSNTKSKHFDKDYLYPDILADHYEKHFKHSNKESEPAHSQVKYENSSPDWYYYGGPSEDVKEDYSYDNWNKITIKNSESSSESLGNTGNINLKEQNNQAWNTLTDFSPSFSHLGFG